MKQTRQVFSQKLERALHRARDVSHQAKVILDKTPAFRKAKRWTHHTGLKLQSRFPSQAQAIQEFLGTQETRLNQFLRRRGWKEVALFQGKLKPEATRAGSPEIRDKKVA